MNDIDNKKTMHNIFEDLSIYLIVLVVSLMLLVKLTFLKQNQNEKDHFK